MPSVDYLVVGAGALGLAFADQILTETDATLAIVDRRHKPGGHWNDAYDFVRLHQPSAYYGVGSRPLGSGRIDACGWNRGYSELASGAQVCAYFDDLMRERFLPSGRVSYLPMHEHLGQGRIVSRLTGTAQTIEVRRKFVDATFFDTRVPATAPPAYEVAPDARLVTPNALPRVAPEASGYVVLGAGKTGMDVVVWLLEMGVDPGAIRWVAPRDSWLLNRETVQSDPVFQDRTAAAKARMLEAAAGADDLDELFDRLEGAGQLLRIDRARRPTMYRNATISTGEVELLASVADVVRAGRVRRVEPDRMVLDGGEVATEAGRIYVDCTASALRATPPRPVFAGRRITVQMVRAGLLCLSAAVIAHLEAEDLGEAERNDLCQPIPPAETALDWARHALLDLQAAARWARTPALRAWLGGQRLAGAAEPPPGLAPPDPALAMRIRAARAGAEANLARLLGETGLNSPAALGADHPSRPERIVSGRSACP